ncbi:TonB-dependent receptor plug domain-containing protein [Ferruginibacter paludis]|uniref:TonB-dependent receptor plug domain-containing protein n=1 Tax=Ferruginibacter paludis TaxID=1310417 RepID=UPI0025B4E98F|nr:TonB-dependent receptor plug domain-containing protein [Ferruginibacter paludis]MDN3657366.1 TonB-dependent receptor plug domain-containing protein [Ferruginibacter paludis]
MKAIARLLFKKKVCLPLLAGLFIFAGHEILPPTDTLQQLVDNYYNFCKQFPQQKIHIHTDKPYYFSGDDMFGKIYLINEDRAGLDSNRSKKIYVELINDENTVVEKAIVNGMYSSLNFSFHLNDSIPEGNYTLRAYTLWMTGFNNAQNIFSNSLYIFNKNSLILSDLSYPDSTLSTVAVQLQDTAKNAYANRHISYQLLYKDRLVEKAATVTNAGGKFSVNLHAIAVENRNDAILKININGHQKLLRLPSFNSNIDVQFLPEGGNLVNDIENYVALKAVDQYGYGTDVQGYIKDNKGKAVCSFSSTHLGMGKFEFVPVSGVSYTAYIQTKNGKIFTVPLAPADNYAYQLTVAKRSDDALHVRVALGDSLYKKNKVSYLVATSRNKVCFTSRGTDLYEATIPLNNFPEGIAQLTLFDEGMQPVSERLVYVHHPGVKVSITGIRANYKAREKVTLGLKVTDATGTPLQGMYSIAVTDDNMVKHKLNESNIKTHLLLSPYLKGYIEQPGYYFNNNTAAQLDLDLVMLTHGWSRFNWSDVKSNARINVKEKDSSLSISGTITTGKNAPAAHYAVMLFSATDNAFIGVDTTDQQGRFHFAGVDYSDSTSFIVQTKNPKGTNENVNVIMDATHFPLTYFDRSFNPQPFNPDQFDGINLAMRVRYDSLRDKEKARLLQEVFVNSRKRKVNYDESRRVSMVSHIIPSDFIEKYGNFSLRDVFYSVPGATIMDGHISFFGWNSFNFSEPLYILDGVEVSDALGAVNPYDIDFIEVLRGGEAAIYGVRGGNGVILINTKKGSDSRVRFVQKGISPLQVAGYHVEKNFYAPRYETDESRQVKIKDERTTIYWNGNVHTDETAPANISFYTADLPTSYTLTIEGIAASGALVHETISLKRTGQ